MPRGARTAVSHSRFIQIFRTTSFRLAGLYLGLFLLSMTAVLGVVYWLTVGFIDRHTEQTIQLEVAEMRETWADRGPIALLRQVSDRAAVPRTAMIYAIATPELDVLAGNLAAWPGAQPAGPGWITFDLHTRSDRSDTRPALARIVPLGAQGWLLVGYDMADRNLLRRQLIAGFLWAVGLAVVVGMFGAALIGRRVVNRIEALNATIGKIAAGHFAERMPVLGTGDELDRLVTNLNRMLDEIGRLMQGLRHVTDNVAHDLRSPLSRLRARLELALIGIGSDDPHRATLEQAVAEIDHLLAVFAAILDIAAAESGRARAHFATVDLGDLARTAAEFYTPLAEEKDVTLTVSADAPAQVQGSRQLLAQALSNLVDNALKYSPPGGAVQVEVDCPAGGGTRLRVRDHGPGIPADQRDQVLDRFFRLEEHRSTPGHGLGLSLVAAVARLHDAELRLEDNHPGLCATLRFPGAA
jgi:signal transduction histidine kinase